MRFVLSVWCQVDGLTVPIWFWHVASAIRTSSSQKLCQWTHHHADILGARMYIYRQRGVHSVVVSAVNYGRNIWRFPFLRQISNAMYRCSCGFIGFWELLTAAIQVLLSIPVSFITSFLRLFRGCVGQQYTYLLRLCRSVQSS